LKKNTIYTIIYKYPKFIYFKFAYREGRPHSLPSARAWNRDLCARAKRRRGSQRASPMITSRIGAAGASTRECVSSQPRHPSTIAVVIGVCARLYVCVCSTHGTAHGHTHADCTHTYTHTSSIHTLTTHTQTHSQALIHRHTLIHTHSPRVCAAWRPL